MAKLLPIRPREGKNDEASANSSSLEEDNGQNVVAKGNSKKKKKRRRKKTKTGDESDMTRIDDFESEDEIDEETFRQMFTEEVISERSRIRPNTAYDDGTRIGNKRNRQKKGASSSLDLVEAEGSTPISKLSRSSKLFQAPDEEQMIFRNTLVVCSFRKCACPMRIIYLRLSSWQQQVESVLEQSMRSHQKYYDGMHGLESMDDASLEHRSVKTGAGNASTAFDKNKNAKVNLTTAEKRKIEEEEGRRVRSSATTDVSKKAWHIQRMTVNNGEGAVFHCVSNAQMSEIEEKMDVQNETKDAQENRTNIRASVLCTTDVQGDAVWMRKDGDEEISAMLQADRNAILRFINEEKARKKRRKTRA